jgi:hypothetical protein
VAHQAIPTNLEPESPQRGGGPLDWSSPADEGWRRAAAALRTAEEAASARPPDDLMRQHEADDTRASSPVDDHFTNAASTNAEPQQVTRQQRNGSGNGAQAGNGDERSTENRDESINGEDQIR